MEARRFLSRLAGSVAWGALRGLVYYLLIVYVAPMVSGYLYASLAGDLDLAEASLPAPTHVFLAAGLIFIGLSTAAGALKGTVAEPLLRATAALLGFAFTYLILWRGTLSVEVEESGARVAVSLDLTPLLAAYFAFITLPGMLLPFINYAYDKAERGDAHSPNP